MPKWNHNRMRVITSNLPQNELKIIEKFIEWGMAPSRSEYIRKAIRHQIDHDYEFVKKTDDIKAGVYDHMKFVKVPGIEVPFRVIRRLE